MTVRRTKRVPAGWTEGSVKEFLGFTDADEAIVEMRLRLGNAIRDLRRRRGVSQSELARRIGTKQPHVSDIEKGAAGLETMIRAYLALGGKPIALGKLVAEAA